MFSVVFLRIFQDRLSLKISDGVCKRSDCKTCILSVKVKKHGQNTEGYPLKAYDMSYDEIRK